MVAWSDCVAVHQKAWIVQEPYLGSLNPNGTERMTSQRRTIVKKRIFSPPALIVATLTLVLSLLAGAGTLSAQGDATPSAGGHDHPAHIHDGTCEELGDVVYPLDNVTDLSAEASPEASTPMASTMGDEMENTVAESTTIVDVSLDDLLSADYAINVHESPDQIQNYIACGDVDGEASNGHLEVDLNELNDSGYTGRAELTENPDDTTTVTITLMQGASMETPEATPAS